RPAGLHAQRRQDPGGGHGPAGREVGMEVFLARGKGFPLTRTYVMGILNVTPDSFSDGGRYLDPAAALARAREMEQEGADILDVGGQSTRPGHTPVSPEEEWTRLKEVLPALL